MAVAHIGETGSLSLVIENRELSGSVNNIELTTDTEFYDYDGRYRYETYTITAEFVPDSNGIAYTIKELPVKKIVTHTAEVDLDEYRSDFDAEDIQKVVKKARKRAGAPKGAQWNVSDFPIFNRDAPVRIKFHWTTEA